MRASLVVLLLCCAMAPPTPACAQEVRGDSLFGWGSNLRRFDRAAEDAGRTDWPSPRDGRPGTRVQITFSARNADVTLATEVGYTSAALLQRAQALTKRLDLPQADFITVETRRTAIVDIELNDYLQRGRFRSGFDLDLAGLAAALKAADLPQPVVIGVEESGDTALVTPGGRQALAHQAWFAAPNEVPVGARLVYEARITWRVIPALLLFVIMPVFLMGALLLRSFRRPLPADATPLPSPGEVQKEYDRQAPVWTMLAGLMVLPLVLVFVLSPKDPFAGLDLLLPFSPTYLMFGVAGLSVVGTAVTALRRRRTLRTNAGETPSSSEDPGDDPPAWAKFGWMGVLMVGMLGMPLLILIPVYNPQAQLWLLYALFGWMGLMVVGAVLVGWLGMRASRTELRDGRGSRW